MNNRNKLYVRIKILTITILSIINISAFSKDVKRVYLRNLSTGKAIESVAVYANNEFCGYSNKRGVVELKGLSDSSVLVFTHPGYVTMQVKCDSLPQKAVIKLKQISNSIKEIEVVAKETFWIQRALLTIYPFIYGSLGTQSSILYTFVPYTNKRYIKNIKYRLTEFHGTKGLTYLPFKANLFTVDTINKLPKERIFIQDTTIRREKSKWVKLDISSYKIKVPKEGIFIAFIIPDSEFYDNREIRSRAGLHPVAPAIGTRVRWARYKTYSVSTEHSRLNRIGDYYYMMEFEYCDE
jgi:hypothetical protein